MPISVTSPNPMASRPNALDPRPGHFGSRPRHQETEMPTRALGVTARRRGSGLIRDERPQAKPRKTPVPVMASG